MIRRIGLVLILWVMVVGPALAQPQAAPPYRLPNREEAEVLALTLAARLRGGHQPTALRSPDADTLWVALTLTIPGEATRIVWSNGPDTESVLSSFGVAVRNLPQSATIRVDVAYDVVRERLDAPEFRTSWTGDRWGVAFEPLELGMALPAEVEARQLFDAAGIMDRERWVEWAADRGFDATALAEALTLTPLDVYRFETAAAVQRPGEPAELLRVERAFADDLTPLALREASLLAGSYLTRAVRDDGSFDYEYDAGTGRSSSSYNMLRHAGTTYAMFELEGILPDPVRRAAAERALSWALGNVGPCSAPVSGAEAACLIEDGEVKLGGQGLLLLALAEYAEVTGDLSYIPSMRALAEWIVGAQFEDGTFVHVVNVATDEVRDFTSQFYPGEAAFGLLRLYQIDPDPRWLSTAQRAIDAIIEMNAGLADDEVPSDHWLLYAMAALNDVAPDAVDRGYVRRLSWIIVQQQHRERVPDEWIGGYGQPPRSTPTATRSEGLCAVLPILAEDDPLIAADVRDAVLAGIAFQLQTQITAEDALYLADPDYAAGGFTGELYGYEVRIDYVQHNLSSLLCAAEVLGSD